MGVTWSKPGRIRQTCMQFDFVKKNGIKQYKYNCFMFDAENSH